MKSLTEYEYLSEDGEYKKVYSPDNPQTVIKSTEQYEYKSSDGTYKKVYSPDNPQHVGILRYAERFIVTDRLVSVELPSLIDITVVLTEDLSLGLGTVEGIPKLYHFTTKDSLIQFLQQYIGPYSYSYNDRTITISAFGCVGYRAAGGNIGEVAIVSSLTVKYKNDDSNDVAEILANGASFN